MRDIGVSSFFFMCDVIVWLWYQSNTSLIEWIFQFFLFFLSLRRIEANSQIKGRGVNYLPSLEREYLDVYNKQSPLLSFLLVSDPLSGKEGQTLFSFQCPKSQQKESKVCLGLTYL